MRGPAGTAGAPPARALNPSDSDLCLQISASGTQCSTISKDGFGYMLGGIRGSQGVLSGRWCFHVKFVGVKNVNVQDTAHLSTSYIARVGVSQLHTPVGRLGEPATPKAPPGTSIGLNNTGSYVDGGRFVPLSPAWPPFKPGDTLTVFVDLASGDAGRIGYALNGELLGFLPEPLPHPQKQLQQQQQSEPREVVGQTQPDPSAVALFPHLVLRNCILELDVVSGPPDKLAGMGTADAGGPYQPWLAAQRLSSCGCTAPGWPPPPPSQCEVIMMVGLPGSGKTTWALEHSRQQPGKRYMLLSPVQVLDSMRVLSLRSANVRKRLADQLHSSQGAAASVDQEHAIEQYYGLANATYQQLLTKAATVPRNYIIDQTNVNAASREAKLAPFRSAGFKLRAALAAPYLAYLNMLQETSQSEGAPHLPDTILLSLMADFSAPQVGGPEGFQEVLLVHEPRTKPGTNPQQESERTKVARVAKQVVDPQRALAKQRLQGAKDASTAQASSAAGAGAGTQPSGVGGPGSMQPDQGQGPLAAASKTSLTNREQLLAAMHLPAVRHIFDELLKTQATAVQAP